MNRHVCLEAQNIYWHIFDTYFFLTCIKRRLRCKYSSQNIFNAKSFIPHKKTFTKYAHATRVCIEPGGQQLVYIRPLSLEPITQQFNFHMSETNIVHRILHMFAFFNHVVISYLISRKMHTKENVLSHVTITPVADQIQ